MQLRYRYRLYPAPAQEQALARAFGCARVVYNDCLRLRGDCRARGEKISDAGVQRRVVTLAKLTPGAGMAGRGCLSGAGAGMPGRAARAPELV